MLTFQDASKTLVPLDGCWHTRYLALQCDELFQKNTHAPILGHILLRQLGAAITHS